jgi:signal transduction histidine kinase
LVRTLTQLHGGSVSAWSEGPGAGCIFTVRLPIVLEPLQHP